MEMTRKLNETELHPLDESIRIAEGGEAVRLIGAWLGNKTEAAAPWEPIIDKINKALKFYSKGHPTLEGRKVIAQIVIGGYTQFLTKVQGMPKQIEKVLTKITCDFIWEENTSPRIDLDHLFNSIQEGGLNLIYITARNEAIEIEW